MKTVVTGPGIDRVEEDSTEFGEHVEDKHDKLGYCSGCQLTSFVEVKIAMPELPCTDSVNCDNIDVDKHSPFPDKGLEGAGT